MKSVVHEEFVKAIRKSILDKDLAVMKFEKDQVVSIISDILCLGREAVYRRLRGEVKFSLEEATRISLKLNISIDSLIGIESKERATIELNFVEPKDDFKQRYRARIESYADLFEAMSQRYADVSILSSFNKLPYIFYLQYENLSKFRLFKWAYQMRLTQNQSIDEMIITDEIQKAQMHFISEIRKVKNTSLVLSPSVFSSFVNDVKYFYNLGLINKGGVQSLKNELLSLLDEMERYAVSGKYETNNNVKIYLSDLDLDTTYILFRYNKHSYAHINLYDIGGIETQNEKISECHFLWIDSLKRYSKLITQGNELERYRFFNQQRLLIDNLGWDKDFSDFGK